MANTHSLALDGTNAAYLADTNDITAPNSNLFISAWIKPSTDSQQGGIVTKGCYPGSNNPAQFFFRLSSSPNLADPEDGDGLRIQFAMAYHSGPQWLYGGVAQTGGGTIAVDAWNHVGVYYRAVDPATNQNVRLYINGAQAADADSGNPTLGEIMQDTDIEMVIGAMRNQGDTDFDVQRFQGLIDEIEIRCNPGLSLAQADAAMLALFTKPAKTGTAIYRFDNSLDDASGSGLHLTGYNSPSFSTDRSPVSDFIPQILVP